MVERDYVSVRQLQRSFSQLACPDPAAFERGSYMERWSRTRACPNPLFPQQRFCGRADPDGAANLAARLSGVSALTDGQRGTYTGVMEHEPDTRDGGEPSSRQRRADVRSRSDRASRVETAADAVRSWIAERKLEGGARIPSERELAEQLEVSRTVMREALSSLEALGLIERRTTIGRFVAAGHPGRSQALVRAWLHQHRDEIYEVDEIRALIERHIVQEMGVWDCIRAAGQAAGIIVRQEEALGRGDAFAAARLDSEFHKLLCSHTENRMLRDLACSLIEHMPSVGLAVYSLPDAAARSLEGHEAIVRALERCDAKTAADIDFAHTQEAGRRLRGGIHSPSAALAPPGGST